MANNPIPIILVILLLKNRGGLNAPMLNSLQLESFLDNAHTMLNTLDKLNSFAQSDLSSSLPDMKKMMEIVEKLPL